MEAADFDVKRVAVIESKADPPLVVDRYRVLPLSIASQRVESVPRRRTQIVEPHGQIDVFEFSRCASSHVLWKPACLARLVQVPSPLIGKGLNQSSNCNVSRDDCQIGKAGIDGPTVGFRLASSHGRPSGQLGHYEFPAARARNGPSRATAACTERTVATCRLAGIDRLLSLDSFLSFSD